MIELNFLFPGKRLSSALSDEQKIELLFISYVDVIYVVERVY